VPKPSEQQKISPIETLERKNIPKLSIPFQIPWHILNKNFTHPKKKKFVRKS
jgi:hypothetical protein